MYLQTLSYPLQKALRLNSNALVLQDLKKTGTEPRNGSLTTLPLVDGIFGDRDASEVPNGIKIYPFSEGGPGGQYWIRVWSWTRFGNNVETEIWMPVVLATLFCVAGIENGIKGRVVKDTEWFAGAVSVYNGSAQAGSNGGAAYAIVSLLGCPKFQFDIAQGDGVLAPGNALWAFIS